MPIIIEMKQCVDWSSTIQRVSANEKVLSNICLSRYVRSSRGFFYSAQVWPSDILAAGPEVEVQFCSFATEKLPPAQHLESARVSQSALLDSTTIDHEDGR